MLSLHNNNNNEPPPQSQTKKNVINFAHNSITFKNECVMDFEIFTTLLRCQEIEGQKKNSKYIYVEFQHWQWSRLVVLCARTAIWHGSATAIYYCYYCFITHSSKWTIKWKRVVDVAIVICHMYMFLCIYNTNTVLYAYTDSRTWRGVGYF